MDAKTIAGEIEKFIFKTGLDPDKFKGQGYDGCSTMSGKDNGVQSILREKFPNALYFHCASHKLNLVVNDLNDVPEIRNTTATIKDVINYYRDSITRRKYVPKIPAFCETRWSEKYKSIAIFKENFVQIVNGLEKLSNEGNSSTRTSASFCRHADDVYCVSFFDIETFCLPSASCKYSTIKEARLACLQGTNPSNYRISKRSSN